MPAPALLCVELTTTGCTVITFWINMFAFPSPSPPALSSSAPRNAALSPGGPGACSLQHSTASFFVPEPSPSGDAGESGTRLGGRSCAARGRRLRFPVFGRVMLLVQLTQAPDGPGTVGTASTRSHWARPVAHHWARTTAKGCGPSFWRFRSGPAWSVGFLSKGAGILPASVHRSSQAAWSTMSLIGSQV